MSIHDNVSEADMRFFHDKAMVVFREKAKLDAKVVFSITGFNASGISGFFVKHNHPYPDLDTVPLPFRNLLPSREVWNGLSSGDDMAPFSVNGLRFESDKYSSDPPDAFGVN